MGAACNKTFKKPLLNPPSSNDNTVPINPLTINTTPINTRPFDTVPMPINTIPINPINPVKTINIPVSNTTKQTNLMEETPQKRVSIPEKHKEYWEMKTIDEIYERLISLELNKALKKGQVLKVILEMIIFESEEDVKILNLKICQKIIEDFQNSERKKPEILEKIVGFIQENLMESLREYYSKNGNENLVNNHLEIIVEFYQICLCFLLNTIANPDEKWWTLNKTDDFLEILWIKFTEIHEKIKEKIEESPQKNTKLFINVDIEQEFKKVGNNSMENLWDNCEIIDEMEGIEIKINSNEFVPKVKQKKKPFFE